DPQNTSNCYSFYSKREKKGLHVKESLIDNQRISEVRCELSFLEGVCNLPERERDFQYPVTPCNSVQGILSTQNDLREKELLSQYLTGLLWLLFGIVCLCLCLQVQVFEKTSITDRWQQNLYDHDQRNNTTTKRSLSFAELSQLLAQPKLEEFKSVE
ncbi:hypothetical protein GQX74_001479, partial [Glossina fuscipes]